VTAEMEMEAEAEVEVRVEVTTAPTEKRPALRIQVPQPDHWSGRTFRSRRKSCRDRTTTDISRNGQARAVRIHSAPVETPS